MQKAVNTLCLAGIIIVDTHPQLRMDHYVDEGVVEFTDDIPFLADRMRIYMRIEGWYHYGKTSGHPDEAIPPHGDEKIAELSVELYIDGRWIEAGESCVKENQLNKTQEEIR